MDLLAALAHRYPFDGVDTRVADTVGNADGESASPLRGDGALALLGDADQDHVTLPSGILSSMQATTIELWLTWQGSQAGERVISFGSVAPGVGPRGCARGPALYAQGSWYRVCTDERASWASARSRCEQAGGQLLAIETEAEQDFIASQLTRRWTTAWFGANDMGVEGEWHFATREGVSAGSQLWQGGADGRAPDGAFANWRLDAPEPSDNNPNFNCGYLTTTGEWGSWDCAAGGPFVCEWSGLRGAAMGDGLFLTPADARGQPQLTLAIGGRTISVSGPEPFPRDSETHVALVLDPGASGLTLFIDGAAIARAESPLPLSELRDADNWLGRSHIAGAPGLHGVLHELRIYDRALSAPQLAASYLAGPDPDFLER